MVQLEKFTEKDEQQLISWITSSSLLVQWAGSSFIFPLTAKQLKSYREMDNIHIYKAVDEGKTVGHAALKNIDLINRSARIGHVFIQEASRGKGIGIKMIDKLLDIAFNELKLHKVSLGVFDFNEPAIHIYKKAGFQVDGCLRDHRRVNNNYWSLWEMSILEHEWNANNL
ncbi:GNAT family N-acetyltransferase [Halobacillus massiliensis]|uniref:GNAT family N-acetyltransferase n=1 Tax=Halobacillus massiliensis TaxID=1926286 RepID=UPI0009E2BBE0|nr:GNAT family protein [Halobacillus massiliensis]